MLCLNYLDNLDNQNYIFVHFSLLKRCLYIVIIFIHNLPKKIILVIMIFKIKIYRMLY